MTIKLLFVGRCGSAERKMAATDGQIVVAAARWADEGQYLRELVSKQRLPAVVKIIKGQYGGLGVPTLPAPGLQSAALLVSAGRRQKIAAQSVKLKEGRRLTPVGPRLAIPDTYPGYFELLSEEGRAVRCIEGAAELARRHSTCIVREPLRGVCARVDPDSGSVVAAEGARTIAAGETLSPVGEVNTPQCRTHKMRTALHLLGILVSAVNVSNRVSSPLITDCPGDAGQGAVPALH